MMKKGELSSEKYVSNFLEHIEKREPAVGAWSYIEPEMAIQQAKEADKRWKINKAGKLNGLAASGSKADTSMVSKSSG